MESRALAGSTTAWEGVLGGAGQHRREERKSTGSLTGTGEVSWMVFPSHSRDTQL